MSIMDILYRNKTKITFDKVDVKKLEQGFYGFICGDALGVPYEFKKRDTFICNDMRSSENEDFHGPLPKGTWSDDSALMLCVADALINGKNIDQQYEIWKNNAIEWMSNGKFMPISGTSPYDIGNSIRKGIISLSSGMVNSSAVLESSNGNGGLMKMLPLATVKYKNNKDVLENIIFFNECSHAHQTSNIGCVIYIYLLKNILMNMTFEESYNGMLAVIDNKYKIPEYNRIWDKSILDLPREQISSSGYVVDTLEAAIWCLYHSTTYQECVLTAVNLGSDTDTIAAISGGLAGALYQNIPCQWMNDVMRQPDFKFVNKVIKQYITKL